MDLFTNFEIPTFGVVPVLVGPLQALLAILPALCIALGGILISLFKPKAIKYFMLLLWRQKIVVTILLAIIWGIGHLINLGLESNSAELTEISKSGSDWNMHRGGVSRRGATLDAEDPGHGNIQWSFSNDGIKSFYSSPAIVGNRIYASSARWELFKKDGAIYSIDRASGKLVWKFNEGGYRATFSSPSISGQRLVVGEGLHLTKNARIFCLDLEASEKSRKGVKLWEFQTNSHVESSPCIADGKVFCGAGDDGLYCLQLEPDKDQKAKVLWHLDGKDFPDCETSPIYYEGKVYFGLGIGGQAICCVDAVTGKLEWRIETPFPVFSSPSIYKGSLYVGMGHGDFVNKAEVVAKLTRDKLKAKGLVKSEIEEAVKDIRPSGEVWSIDLKSHKVNWKFEAGRTILGSVAVADDRIYFGSRDKHLYCVSIDGKLIKKWNARAPIITSPAIGKSLVYAVTEAGRVIGLDKDRMSLIWDVELNSPSFSSPSIGGGHLYVGTNKEGLVCVGEVGMEKKSPLWQGERGGPGLSGANDGSLLPGKGKYSWSYKGHDLDSTKGLNKTLSSLMFMDEALYFGSIDSNKNGLVKIDTNKKMAKPNRVWFAESDNPVSLSACGTEETVYFVDGKEGDANRFLRAISVKDGSERTRFPIKDGSGEFMLTEGHLIIQDQKNSVSLFDISEPTQLKKKWHWGVGHSVGTPLIKDNFVVLAINQPASIVVLDKISGSLLWEKRINSPALNGPIFAGDKIWIPLSKGLIGLPLTGFGEEIYLETGTPLSAIVNNGQSLSFINDQSEVILVDILKCSITKRIQNAFNVFPPLLTNNALLYLTKDALMRYDLNSNEQHLWTKIRAKWPGNLSSSMVMIDSYVFFGTETRGMVCMKAK